ncbi:Hsp20/alpha crystallin family protein [Paludisphaera rhizosphaerae]|uniref:Hsp20/alpha crystallin family protein n=1 Tax=Paludisphaera rhizosphaerae TaxID=2711216 RepID=UPI0013EB78CD|nr:Hsp20/alpha crystallin family protein [Paludisphaera rhizosphaerae]
MSRLFPDASPFQTLEREFFRFLKDAFQAGPSVGDEPPATVEPYSPPVDVYETPEETIVVVELPGVDPATVEVTADGDVLTIQGTRLDEAPAVDSLRRPREGRIGPFLRHVHLTREVDLDAARADGRHGVLTIRLPRPPAQKPRSIPIRTD